MGTRRCFPPWFKVCALMICLCGSYYGNIILPELQAQQARMELIASAAARHNAGKARYHMSRYSAGALGPWQGGTMTVDNSRDAVRERAQRKMEQILRSSLTLPAGADVNKRGHSMTPAEVLALTDEEAGVIYYYVPAGKETYYLNNFNRETIASVPAGHQHRNQVMRQMQTSPRVGCDSGNKRWSYYDPDRDEY